MIEFSRALAYRFRAVVHRCLMSEQARGPWPVVVCRTDSSGLTLEAKQGEVGVRYHQNGAFEAEVLAFRGDLLAAIESPADTAVILETTNPGRGQARWTARGATRVAGFAPVALDAVPAFPNLPDNLRPQPPELLAGLADAAAIASTASVRYATNRIQLHGRAGAIVATDGKQMLLHGGFEFPWTDELLVPALPVFGTPEFAGDGPITLGRTQHEVILGIDRWTLALTVDAEGRFPNAHSIVPKLSAVTSRVRFHPQDASYLMAALPTLPGGKDDPMALTLELGSRVAVQAWSTADGPAVDITLARSVASGMPTRICTDRQCLLRALSLHFTELQVTKADAPLCCRDNRRCYLWATLDPAAQMPADIEVQHITTTDADRPSSIPTPASVALNTPTPITRTAPMATPAQNGNSGPETNQSAEAPAPGCLADVLAEAEALRDALQNAFSRAARLVSALKLQRRHTKAVQQAVASLRHLHFER